MENEKKTKWKALPIISSALTGSTVGIIVDFFAKQDILFTLVGLGVGLVVGVILTIRKKA